MAEKIVFISSKDKPFEEALITYQYYSGFAVSQKQKSIQSLHEAIRDRFSGKKILEISTKSENELGIRLSAFNLKCYCEGLNETRSIENIFQSSKVFENGGPYRSLLNVSPKDAKKDDRIRNSGRLIHFELNGEKWALEPKTMFYDWTYIMALKQNEELANKLIEYDIFTDIEFNHKKSINCQARSAAMFVSLERQGKLNEKTESPEAFRTLYDNKEAEQISMF